MTFLIDTLFNNTALAISLSIIITVVLLGLLALLIFWTVKKFTKVKKIFFILSYLLWFLLVATGVFLIGWFFNGAWVGTALGEIGKWFNANVWPLVGVAITIVVALVITRLVLYFLKRGAKRNLHDKRKQTIYKVSGSIVNYGAWIIAGIIIFSILGFNVIGAIAGLGIIGLVIGLGAQKLVNDIISGTFIVFEQHFNVGDTVEIDGFFGTVTDIGLKTTKIKNARNEVKIVANGNIVSLINYSTDKNIAMIFLGIPYKCDVRQTLDLLTKELEDFPKRNPNCITAPVAEGIVSFEYLSVKIRIQCNTVTGENFGVERDLRIRVKEICDQHNILIEPNIRENK